MDVLLTSNAAFQQAREEYGADRVFAERTIRTATPEGLVLLKLFALPSLYRQGDVNRAAIYETDVRMLLHSHGIDTEAILAKLRNALLPSDVDALRRLLTELRRPREGFG